MAAQLGGQQISALLESLPGIASVLRSPVADAIANMIRAGAGVGDFREADANELVQYAVRRGLLGSDEGEELLAEVKGAGKKTRARTGTKKAPRKTKAKRVVKKKATVKKTPSAKKATKTVKKAKVTKPAAKRAKKKR
jgi:polyhydroxyalkanoate synthesis regulator phasin